MYTDKPCGSKAAQSHPLPAYPPHTTQPTQQAPLSTLLQLTTPASLVHQCLTLLRKADVDGFQQHVPHETLRHAAPRIRVGHLHVEEQGALACCCDVLDTAARRMLPGM